MRALALLLLASAAVAQSEEPKIVVNLDGFRYPRIANLARVSGVVTFEVTASGRRLVSAASPLLRASAEANLATWTLPPLATGRYVITYRFEFLTKPRVKQMVASIGTKLERFFRRLVGAGTEQVVNDCYAPDDPPATFTLMKDDDIKIDVFAGTYERCLETEAGQLALNSHL